MLQVSDAAHRGHRAIMVRTVDTYVVVIILSHILNTHLSELWISFGVGKHHRYIATHEIAATMGSCNVSCFHWMRRDPFLRWTKEEDSLGHMGCVFRCH